MTEDTLQVFVYSEQCNQAGRRVPSNRVDDLGEDSPDFWKFTGTREELAEQAKYLLAPQHSMYHHRAARSILDSIYYREVYLIVRQDGTYLEDWNDAGEPVWCEKEEGAEWFVSRTIAYMNKTEDSSDIVLAVYPQ